VNFYKISFQYTGCTKYAWASGYGPIAENIDEIPFLKNAPEAFKKNKQEFWQFNNSPSGIKLDTGGKDWPDILGCGGGPPHFFISERVLTDLKNAGVPYLRSTQMPLIQPFPEKLRAVPPPLYYVLEGIPGLEASWAAMGVPHDSENRVNFSGGYPKPWPPAQWKVSLSSWTGLDLMSYKNWQMPMTLICPDEIKDIAKAKKWTNVLFQALITVD
jgi:hypothetical protein